MPFTASTLQVGGYHSYQLRTTSLKFLSALKSPGLGPTWHNSGELGPAGFVNGWLCRFNI